MPRIPTGTNVPPGWSPATRRFRDDERGQLLILTGVLLVLGFVVIGTTVVQLQAIEESTSRLHRDALLDSVDHLVANFNETMAASIDIGETNTTDFKQRVGVAEKRLRDTATRAGLYVAVELNGDVDKDVFWRDSRCLAYNIDEWETGEGIVVGYERETTKETIAGAVYNIHITDGRQTIRMDYYAKIFDCMIQNTPSHIADATAAPGTVQNVTGSYKQDDVGLFWVNETLSGTLLRKEWAAPDTPSGSVGWTSLSGIKTDGGTHSQVQLPSIANFLDFQFVLPPDLEHSHTIPDLDIGVHAWSSFAGDDKLFLGYYATADPLKQILDSWEVPLPLVETNHTISPADGPEGNAHWTRAELEDHTFRLWSETVLLPDTGRQLRVDFVTANVSWEQPEGYQLAASFDFDEIPPVFDVHEVEVRYRFKHDAAMHVEHEEEFYLQVYDGVDEEWDTLDTWTDTGGVWTISGPWTLLKDANDDQSNGNEPRFRLVDEISNDDGEDDDLVDPHEDRDSIEIDWFELTSSVSGT